MVMPIPKLIDHLVSKQSPQARADFLREQAVQFDADGREHLAHALKKSADQALGADIHEALNFARLLQAWAEVTHNQAHMALGLLAEANARSIGMGEHQRAIGLYDMATDIYRDLNLPVEQATSQIGKIGALLYLGDYDQALEAGEWASKVLERDEQWLPLAKMTGNLGIVYNRLGDDPNALAQFDRAQLFYSKLGMQDQPGWLRAELNRAIILRNLGRFEASIQASNNAASKLEALGNIVDAARARQSLALTYFVLGKYNETQVILDQVREVFLADGRMPDAVLAELYISDCLLELRRFQDVLEVCRRVREYFTELGTRFEMTLAILNEAVAYAGLGRFEEALASLKEARDNFEEEGNSSWAKYCDLQIAGVLLKIQDYPSSLAVAQACIAAFAEEPVRQAHARLTAAKAMLYLDRIPEARELVEAALTADQAADLPTITYSAHYLLGRIAHQAGQSALAMEEYELAVEDLERLRGRMMVEYRAGFLEEKGVLYEDLVELSVELDQPVRGLEYAERAKSRALLDLLTHRLDMSLHARDPRDKELIDELEELIYRRDRLYRRWESQAQQELNVRSWSALQEGRQQAQESVLAIEKRITDLWHTLLIRNADYAQEASLWQIRSEPIQPFIPEGALLLEYFIAYDNIYLFLVDQTQIKVTRLSTDLGSVQKHIQLLWHNMRLIPRVSPRHIPALTKNAEGILFQLYQDLLAGVEDDLASFERLIVVPHGPLHYLPFHALHDGQEYLLERFEIGYLPGGSFLRFIKPADPGIDGVLVGANSFEGRLPHTHIEADRIAGLWGTQPLLEGETTLERITTLAPASRAIHLATHGDFRPDNPLFSGLALADGWLTTLSIFNLRLQASLVTLSACETGRNVISGGDELLGLMRAFLSAGAASLVLSLWAVEDRSTAHLMEAFYSGLKQGLEKGEALRAAQRLLLNGQAQDEADLRQAYRHPYFWAPFILVGHSGAL